MRIEITSRRHQLSDHLKEYIESKVSKLEKYAHGDCDAHVVMERKDNFQTVEITVHALHKVLHAEDTGDKVRACIDKVVSKVEKQMRRLKDKQLDKRN